MQNAIFKHLLAFLGLKSLLAMDKRLNLSKKGHDADDNAAKSLQARLSIDKQASNVQKKHDESFSAIWLYI